MIVPDEIKTCLHLEEQEGEAPEKKSTQPVLKRGGSRRGERERKRRLTISATTWSFF